MLAHGFFEWFSGTDGGLQVVFIALAASTVVIIAWAIAWAWVRVRRADIRSRLTTDMLQRGMNPAEIGRVLLAYELTTPEAIASEEDASATPDVRMIKAMSAQDYEGEDIQRVLTAARTLGGINEQQVGIVREMANAWAGTDDIIHALESPTNTAKNRGCGGPQPSCA